MILECFAVRDKAIGAFTVPFFVRARGEALRQFQDAVNDQKSALFAHSSDYDLFYIGSFDDVDGVFHFKEAERVASAADVKMKSAL